MSESDDDLQYFREQLYEAEAETQRLRGILGRALTFVEGRGGSAMSAEQVAELRRLLASA